MRYTNSEKVPESYLVKEKEKIQKLLEANDFPFMEEYRQRFEGISDLEERYEQLRAYMHLYDAICAWIKSEAFKKKVARYYIEIANERGSYFFADILNNNPIAEVGCLTEWQDLARQFCQKVFWFWDRHPVSQYWYWQACVENRRFANGNLMDEELALCLTKLMQIPDEQLWVDILKFLKLWEWHQKFYGTSNIAFNEPERVKVDFYRATPVDTNWFVGFDFSGQDLSKVEGVHFRKCNLKDTGAVINLSHVGMLPKYLEEHYTRKQSIRGSGEDLRGSNFQGCRILFFNPDNFFFSDYTFDRAYLERNWPNYVMDQKVPAELRNVIYEKRFTALSNYSVKGDILRYIPYFSLEILKRISRVYLLNRPTFSSDEQCFERIIDSLIALYGSNSYWYEFMRKE